MGDTTPPSIVGDSLPLEGSAQTFVNHNFTIDFSEDMLVSAVRDQATYELLGAGGDGFGNGNDVVYTVVPAAYVRGLSNSYHVPDGPLQVDDYRFRIATTMADRNGNPITAEYVRTWSVTDVPGYVYESRDNGGFSTADTISTNVMPGVFDGSFLDVGTTIGTADRPYDSELADLDGDGNLDAAICYLGSGDGFRAFAGDGAGGFTLVAEFLLGGDTWDLELLDWDKDGDLDVAVVVSNQDRVELFRNESTVGNISFTQLASVTVGADPRRLDGGDLNNDTFPDLVVSNHGTNATTGRSISLLINDQAGGFLESKLGDALTPRVRPFGIALADLNKDNKLDVVAADFDNTQRIVVWLGNGDGSFGTAAFYDFPSGWDARSLAIGDFDQDTNPDVVVGRYGWAGGQVSFYPGLGDGTLDTRLEYNTGINQQVNFVRVHDINGDGWPDVAIGSPQRTGILMNRAEGGFGFTHEMRSYGEAYSPSFGDVNNDGRIDMFVPDYDNDLFRILLGEANSRLTADASLPGLFSSRYRGNLTDTNDRDNYSFSAVRGQRLTVAMDNLPGSGNDRRLRVRCYDSVGTQVWNFIASRNSNGTGQNSPYTIPRDGTYFLRVEPWANYFGEYRVRVSLSPADAQLESEGNDSTGAADAVSLTLNGTQLEGRIFGYVGSYESNDYFNLGNLVDGTQINLNLLLPATSTLEPIIEIRDAFNNVKAIGNPGDTTLSYTLSGGDDSTYYARILANSGNGIDAEYLLEVALTDLLPPVVTGSDLPVGTASTLIPGFTLDFNKDLLASSVQDPANYTLISAGLDGAFSTPDDVVYPVLPGSYTSGLSANYSLPSGPLRAGMYEFRAFNLQDTFGNPLPLAFEQQFSIDQVGGFASESEDNQNQVDADFLALNADVVGMLTGAGRGNVSHGTDRDWWRFDAEAGDLLVFEVALPGAGGNSLHFELKDPDNVRVFSRGQNNNDLERLVPIALTKTGSYTLEVRDWNAVRSEYRFRVTLIRALDYESEDNDDIPSADPVNFTLNGNINAADVAGFLSTNSGLDYFDLGSIGTGNTVFVSVTYPDGSTLVPIVGVYSASGVLQGEVNGVGGDDNAEVQVTSTGTSASAH